MAAIEQGTIVRAAVPDPRGGNVKLRPCVVLTHRELVAVDGRFEAVAISSTLPPGPLSADYILLPWHPKGHPKTGLNRKCAAVCTWLVSVRTVDVHEVGGKLPGEFLYKIVRRVGTGREGRGAT